MKKKSIITVISIIVIIISLIGIRYAYSIMIPEVKEENLSQSVIRAKELGLVFDDKTLVNCESLFPGITVTKEFDVTSKSDDELTYNVKFVNVTNDYGTDVVYKLYKNNELVVEETPLPKTKDLEYVYTSISIKPGEKHEYRMEITYLSLEDELQKVDRTAEFHGTIEIDVEENIDETLIYVPKDTESIALTETTTENTFTVRNISSTEDKNYNVILEDIINNTEGETISYSLEKNGEQVASSQISQDVESVYLATNQTLGPGQTDNYTLTITEENESVAYIDSKILLLANTVSKFNATVAIDVKEIDATGPTCTISGNPSDWTTSATLNISASDESGLVTKAYSWDGTTYSSTNTKSVTANGTYTAYVKDKYGNVGSCNIEITKVDNVTPSIKMVSGTYQRNNTTAIATVTYGASGGTTKCVNTSNSNASVTKVSNIGNLGVNTIKCTATSKAGKSSTKSSNITINATLTYGAGLNATETAYGSGTSVIIPTSGIQFGPYYNFNAGCYHIYYYGNNLNLSYKLNDVATGYLGFRAYTNNGSFYSLSTYNYSTTLAHFYLYIPSNSKSVEVVLSNGTNTTVTVDKVLINYHGTTCP